MGVIKNIQVKDIAEIIIINYVEAKKKEEKDMKAKENNLLAANNIKRFAFRNINTVGTTEIHACGDMSGVTHSAQEAHKSLVRG